jgi:site-specific DNA-methyltransferase (adenine-specific)
VKHSIETRCEWRAGRNERIRQGDCLVRVPELATAYGPFQLIYVDPPFNAGGVRRARQDQGERVNGESAYIDHWGGIEGFFAMLEPRLAVLRDALTPDGSLWVHLDHRTVHDTKVVLDRLFGRSAFAGEVIWVPGNGGKKRRGPSVTHQTILIYRRGAEMIWNAQDEQLREPFGDTSLRMHFRQQDETGRYFRERHIAGRTYRYYADAGRKIGSVWQDCPAMNANTPLTRETTGYPTQKPERLLERIVRAASFERGAVLDPMCGSGTTLAVAARLGRSIAACDVSELACRIAAQRVDEALAHGGRLANAAARVL